MRYKQFLFPEETKKHQWLKISWKWAKIVLGTFILVSTIWGCGQIMGDKNVTTGSVISIFDQRQYNIASIFFEILLGTSNVYKNHVYHIVNGQIYEYPFVGIRTWGEAWAQTKSPFYGLFVYPIAWLLINIAKGLGGGNANNPVALIFAIVFTTTIIKLITLVFTFKAQQGQEKMQAVQLKTGEIQAKYKHSKDMYAKQKMQMELMAVYKKEGINPITSFIPMFLSIPFLMAMYNVVRSTNLLKTTQLGLIKLIEAPWSMIQQGHWIYLVIIAVYLPIQICSIFLPMYLNRNKQKVKTKESKAAMKKQIILQSVFMVFFVIITFSTPSGLGIYWIISGGLQIVQTIGFHFYNKNKRNKRKKHGSINEPIGTRFKKSINKINKKAKSIFVNKNNEQKEKKQIK